MTALPARAPETSQAADSVAAAQWAQLRAAAPQAVLTIHRYLGQLGMFLAPASVTVAENALRRLARWMVTKAGSPPSPDIRP